MKNAPKHIFNSQSFCNLHKVLLTNKDEKQSFFFPLKDCIILQKIMLGSLSRKKGVQKMSVRKSPGKETKEENPRTGMVTLDGKKHTQTCPLPARWWTQALFCIAQNQSGSSGGNKKCKKGTHAGSRPLLQGH